jgi:hypothetical protein
MYFGLDGEVSFEIAWRELLVKRLSSVQAVLRRDATAERNALEAAAVSAAGFTTVDEAHEAYGYGYITENQFNLAKLKIENPGRSRTEFALRWVNDKIGLLKGEINALHTDAELRLEYMGEGKGQ